MTTSPELLEHAAAGVAWLRESGWPTRKHDVEIAVDVYMRPTRRRQCLAKEPDHALGQKGSAGEPNQRIHMRLSDIRLIIAEGHFTRDRSSEFARPTGGYLPAGRRSLGLC